MQCTNNYVKGVYSNGIDIQNNVFFGDGHGKNLGYADSSHKAIWIDEGKVKMMGEVNEVCDAYVKAASKATKDQLENINLN